MTNESNKTKGLHFEYGSLTYDEEVKSNEEELKRYRSELNYRLREHSKARDGSFADDISNNYNPLGIRPSAGVRIGSTLGKVSRVPVIKKILLIVIFSIAILVLVSKAGNLFKTEESNVYVPGQEEDTGWFSKQEDGDWYKNIPKYDDCAYSIGFKLSDSKVKYKIVNLISSEPGVKTYIRKVNGKTYNYQYYVRLEPGVYKVTNNPDTNISGDVVGSIVKNSFATYTTSDKRLVKKELYTIDNVPDDNENKYFTCTKINDIKLNRNIEIKSGQIIEINIGNNGVFPIVISKITSRNILSTTNSK